LKTSYMVIYVDTYVSDEYCINILHNPTLQVRGGN